MLCNSGSLAIPVSLANYRKEKTNGSQNQPAPPTHPYTPAPDSGSSHILHCLVIRGFNLRCRVIWDSTKNVDTEETMLHNKGNVLEMLCVYVARNIRAVLSC